MARTKAELQFDTFADFPVSGSANILYIATDTLVAYIWDGNSYEPIGGGGGGSGDVTGPASATDGVPALFNGTTGKLLKNSTPTGTGNPVLQTSPTLTTPRFADNGYIADSSGNEMVLFNENPSAVNYLEIENGATGNPPHLRASGDDTNIGIHLVGKGTGEVSVCDPTDETKRLRFGVSNNGTGIITTLRSNSTGASKTIDLPNASGTIALTSDLSNYAPLSGATFTGNISTPNLIEGYTTIATASGTTTLTVTSTFTQIFTGTLAQTVILPTTGILQGQQYYIVNKSTGLVTIQSSGANTIVILGANTSVLLTANVATPTTAANWNSDYSGVNSASGKVATINNTITLAGTDAQTYTFPSATTSVAGLGTTQTFTGANTFNNASVLAGAATMAIFNTTATNLSFGGAATTLTVGGTPTTAITHSYSANSTATATTKTVNLGTGGAAGSTSNINIGATAGGTTTINSPSISLGSTTGTTTTGTIELGHASDTTLTRVSAGVVAIEGVNIVKAGAVTSNGITMSTAKILGRTTAGTGVIEEIATTGTGNAVLATSPTFTTPILGTPTSGTLTNCTKDGTYGVGYLEIPQNSKSADYTLVLADSGKHIYHPSADTTARIFTIPANASVAYPIGTTINFVNDTSAGSLTIAITTDTLVLYGLGSTGSRTLSANGFATAIKVTSTRWVITGVNLT